MGGVGCISIRMKIKKTWKDDRNSDTAKIIKAKKKAKVAIKVTITNLEVKKLMKMPKGLEEFQVRNQVSQRAGSAKKKTQMIQMLYLLIQE